MDNNINKILDELYQFDPSLRAKEADLRLAVERLLAERPSADLDAASFERIRREVLDFARANPSARPFTVFINQFDTMKKIYLGLGVSALALAAVAIILAPQFTKKQDGGLALTPGGKQSVNRVAKVSASAFGNLPAFGVSGGVSGAGADMAKSSVAPVAMGMGGGGSAISARSAESGKIGIMPPMDYPIFRYVYKGGEVTLDKDTLPVYKRVKGLDAGAISGVIGNLNMSMIDLGRLAGAKVQNVSLMQDSDYGLYAYLDFIEGTVSMSENWMKWRNLEAEKCTDDACWSQYRMKYDQFPADAEVIALADGFLSEYQVDRQAYGPGEVEDFWRRDYERAIDKSTAYVPEAVTVVYPYLLDGQAVRDQSGNKYGLRVNVNVRVMRASGLYGLTTNNYESSDYAMTTDSASVIKVAEKGGNVQYYAENIPGARYVDLELGTPEQTYIQMFNYDQTTGLTSELLVPALVFPVTTDPGAQYYYQKQIVVPLAKEMFDKLGQSPSPTPMPLAEPAVAPMVKSVDTPVQNAE